MRNSYGKGLWNVILENKQRTTSIVRARIEDAFRSNGFLVVKNENEIDKDTISVNARIEKLWTYITLGATKAGLNADISTTLSVNNKELSTVINRKEEYFLVNQNDYANIIKSSLKEYKEKLAKQIRELNLE